MLDGKKVELSRGEFALVPVDKYTVQIADVNLVNQFNGFTGKEEEVLNYKFVILDDKPIETEGEEKPQSTRGKFLWKRVRTAMSQRSWLGKLAKAVQGRDLTKEEEDKFDVESIIGKQVNVMVDHQEGTKDKTKIFVNIINFSKATPGLEPISAEEKAKTTVEKSTAPAVAPKDEEEVDEADELIKDLDQESVEAGTDTASTGESDDAELAAAEAELAAANARAKVAALKAKKK